MNGDQIRETWFCPHRHVTGYHAPQVDDLVRRVAGQLGAGRSARSLIESATFRRKKWGRRYDIDTVDWFLGQFLLPPGRSELTGISDDPWRDLPVAQLVPGVEIRQAPASPDPGLVSSGAYFVEQCENAWRDFGQLPGTRLRWEHRAGRGLVKDLRTTEQQTLASLSSKQFERAGRGHETFSAGGRSFTWKRASAEGGSSPGVAKLAARTARDDLGHFASNRQSRMAGWTYNDLMSGPDYLPLELVDDTGTPIVYTCGKTFNWRALSSVMFPDRRRLRFLIRGTRAANAIMTAVDQSGTKVARYRIIDKAGQQASFRPVNNSVEIIVHPGWKLTDELTLALAISTEWLGSYFERPRGG